MTPGVALKYDQAKPKVSLVPPRALLGVAEVMTYGAKKYSEWNYLKGAGLQVSRYLSAAFRHMIAFSMGEDKDEESGLLHLDHAVCCLMMCREMLDLHPSMDDRPKKVYEEVIKGKSYALETSKDGARSPSPTGGSSPSTTSPTAQSKAGSKRKKTTR